MENIIRVEAPQDRADFKCNFLDDGMICATNNIQIETPKAQGQILLEDSTFGVIAFMAFCMIMSVALLALLKVHNNDICKIERREV